MALSPQVSDTPAGSRLRAIGSGRKGEQKAGLPHPLPSTGTTENLSPVLFSSSLSPERATENSAAPSCAIVLRRIRPHAGLLLACHKCRCISWVLTTQRNEQVRESLPRHGSAPSRIQVPRWLLQPTAYGQVGLRLCVFQGENKLSCYEVTPQQPALSPGESLLSLATLPPAFFPH